MFLFSPYFRFKSTKHKLEIMAPKKCPIQSYSYHHTKGFYIIPEHPVRRQAWVEVNCHRLITNQSVSGILTCLTS